MAVRKGDTAVATIMAIDHPAAKQRTYFTIGSQTESQAILHTLRFFLHVCTGRYVYKIRFFLFLFLFFMISARLILFAFNAVE